MTVTFPRAIANGFRNYFNFSGRSTRSEFWWFLLFNLAVTLIVAYAIDPLVYPGLQFAPPSGTSLYDYGQPYIGNTTLDFLVDLVFFFPGLTLLIRRLRDADHAWYNIFWLLLPILGVIILIVYLVQPTANSARFSMNQPTYTRTDTVGY